MKPFAVAAASLLAALVLAACAPAYVAELDKAASLVSQMTLVGTVGPLSVDQNATGSRFLPPRPTASTIQGVSVQSGFLIVDTFGQESLSAVTGSNQNGGQSFPLAQASAVAPYPLYQFDVTNTLSNQASLLVTNISADSYQHYIAGLTGGGLVLSGSGFPSNVFTAGVNGLSYVPAPSSSSDTFAFFLSLAGASIGTAQLGATTFATGSAFTIASPFPLSGRSLYYFSTATGASVASYYSGGQWNCIQWFGAGSVAVTAMTGVTHRIDAVLGTGDFLSTEGGTLRLYDPSGVGKEVLSVDLKGLQFCYEAYVGTDPYVFFALPADVHHGQMVFSVYAIPSSAMRGLTG